MGAHVSGRMHAWTWIAHGRDTRILGGGELGEEGVLALDVRKNDIRGFDAVETGPPQALEARHESRDVQSEVAQVRTCAGDAYAWSAPGRADHVRVRACPYRALTTSRKK